MTEEKKNSFPVMPTAHWWGLRRKFQQSLPGVVTDNYLASVLDMKPASASQCLASAKGGQDN